MKPSTRDRFLLICLVLLIAFQPALGQQSIVDQFELRSQTFEGLTIPYRLFVPENYDSTRAYPLVLALHGAGERGSDNERHIRVHRLATSWADPVNQAQYPAFVVAPQVPSGGRWTADAPVDESEFNAIQLTTLDILDSLETEFNIDLDRVYAVGLSMGGHGVWDFISRLPERFAAAVPMSGIGDPTQAERISHIPIWAFHGESDTVVPASGSRGIVYQMENLGRDVVYTDCQRSLPTQINFDCPGTLPNSELSARIEQHADMIFTATRGGGHGPWSVWFDHPLLMDWLYAKHRVDPNALQITEPGRGVTEDASFNIAWEFSRESSDSVEVWFSVDDGVSWEKVSTTTNGEGPYQLDASQVGDVPQARIRLVVKNEENFVYGRAESGPFTINLEGNGAPSVKIDDENIRFSESIMQRGLSVDVLAVDPEGDELMTRVLFSIDGGTTFTSIKDTVLQSSFDVQTIPVDLESLPNSAQSKVQVIVNDGVVEAIAETASFIKETPRDINDYVEHIEGEGIGHIALHFIDPNALTGHRYRITLDSTDPDLKRYSVTDLETSSVVLSGIPLSDGILESPLFDGMRIVVKDLEEGMADLEKTGWTAGTSTLGISISGGNTVLALQTVPLLETEKEYELSFSSTIVDTSLALFALPAQEMQFFVREAGSTVQVPVVYRDILRDGRPSSQDVLYILEETEPGAFEPAWEIRFSSNAQTAFPEDGDVFKFVPLKKLSSEDVFEFIAAVGVAVEEESSIGAVVGIESIYPNPFSGRLFVQYHLDRPARVKVELFDMLGRSVGVLMDQALGTGLHEAHWVNDSTQALASGVYMIRAAAYYGDGHVAYDYSSVVRLGE